MSEGPTPEQLTELWQALLHVQRLPPDPQLPQHPHVLDEALAAAYELDETFAVVGIVSYAGGRFAALQELARTSPFGEATITLPVRRCSTPDRRACPHHSSRSAST